MRTYPFEKDLPIETVLYSSTVLFPIPRDYLLFTLWWIHLDSESIDSGIFSDTLVRSRQAFEAE